ECAGGAGIAQRVEVDIEAGAVERGRKLRRRRYGNDLLQRQAEPGCALEGTRSRPRGEIEGQRAPLAFEVGGLDEQGRARSPAGGERERALGGSARPGERLAGRIGLDLARDRALEWRSRVAEQRGDGVDERGPRGRSESREITRLQKLLPFGAVRGTMSLRVIQRELTGRVDRELCQRRQGHAEGVEQRVQRLGEQRGGAGLEERAETAKHGQQLEGAEARRIGRERERDAGRGNTKRHLDALPGSEG